MCGIAAFWVREGNFSSTDMYQFFERASDRGNDGYGVVCLTQDSFTGKWDRSMFKSIDSIAYSCSDFKKFIAKGISDRQHGNQVWLANFRAAPSTEVASKTVECLQPIDLSGIYVVHNGAVSDGIVNEYADRQTRIDSEAIIHTYLKFGKDMKKTMAYLVGGFAFVLIDTITDQLYVVTDYKPLSVGYLRSKGFFVHSMESAGRQLISKITGCTHDGQNVWENYYSHPQANYTIRQIDLDSGMEFETKFNPRFLAPGFDSLQAGSGKKFYVLASGGIDSGMTACILKKLGYDVTLVYYNYGQKGAEAERYCSDFLSCYLGCKYIELDVKDVFAGSTSALIDTSVEIETGTEEGLKSTQAWVPFRNAYFMSRLVVEIEKDMLKSNLEQVYVCGGYANMEEESFYGDNSQRFIESFFEMVTLGSIVGSRIKFCNVFQNLMKYEEWFLGDKLGFPFQATVSCDAPRVVMDRHGAHVELCEECGSTLMSKWAAEQAGVKDPRKFYHRLVNLKMREKRVSGKVSGLNLDKILSRLILPDGGDMLKLRKLIVDRVGDVQPN